MKATLFLAALASTAIAVPLLNNLSGDVNGVVAEVEETVDGIPVVGGLVGDVARRQLGDVTKTVEGLISSATSSGSLTDVSGLTTTLTGMLSTVKEHTQIINQTIADVKTGGQTKEAALTVVYKQISSLHSVISTVTSTLGGVTSLNTSGDVDEVYNLLVTTVNEVISTVNGVVSELGLTSTLSALIGSVISLVASLLSLVVGLLGPVLPALAPILSPLLAAVASGPLGSLLAPIIGLLGGL